MTQHGAVLVFAPNQAGEQFVQALNESGRSFAVMVCSSAESESQYSGKSGNANPIRFSMQEESLINPPESEFSKVYIFEEELDQCCKVLETIRKWTGGTIYVITRKHYPQMIYRALGADYVIRSTSNDLSFLIEKEVY